MERRQRLPKVSEGTVARFTAEKAGQEDGLEQGLQLDLGVIFDQILRTGKSAQLDQAERSMDNKREDWLSIFPKIESLHSLKKLANSSAICSTILARSSLARSSSSRSMLSLTSVVAEEYVRLAISLSRVYVATRVYDTG